jgi:Ca2+-transporting ATPase
VDSEVVRNAHGANPAVTLKITSAAGEDSMLPPDDLFADRRRIFGTGKIPQWRWGKKSVLKIVVLILRDPVLASLVIVSIILLALDLYRGPNESHDPAGGRGYTWKEFTTLLVIAAFLVCVETLMGCYMDGAILAIQQKIRNHSLARVIRSGKVWEIPEEELVAGDLVLLETGKFAAVDGIVVAESSLSVDESTVTGETDILRKTSGLGIQTLEIGPQKEDPFIISGSFIRDGTGVALATAVGSYSTQARIILSLREEASLPQSEEQLRGFFGRPMAIFGIFATVCLLLGMFVKFLVLQATTPAPAIEKVQWFLGIVVLSATALILGLSTSTTVAGDFSTFYVWSRLAKMGYYYHRPLEKLSTVSTLLLDLDTLLQQDQACVQAFSVGTEVWDWKSVASSADGSDRGARPNLSHALLESGDSIQTIFAQSIIHTSAAYQVEDQDCYRGPGIDSALLDFAHRELDASTVRRCISPDTTVHYWPRNISEGRQFAAAMDTVRGRRPRLYLVGEHAALARKCSSMVSLGGNGATAMTVPLSDECRTHLDGLASELGARSMQVLAVAYAHLDERTVSLIQNGRLTIDRVADLVYLSTVGVAAPLCEGTRECVQSFQKAGVFVRIITAGAAETATSIARRCGILFPGAVAMKAAEFKDLTVGAQKQLMPRLCVVSEYAHDQSSANISHFYTTLHEMKESVAMVVSSLPLQGYRSGDIFQILVARERAISHLVDPSILTFNSAFPPVAAFIIWARAGQEVMRRLAKFSVTLVITTLLVVLVVTLPNRSLTPLLRPVHLIWLYFLVNVMGSIAFVFDLPRRSILDRKPSTASASIISLSMWKSVAVETVYQLAVLLTVAYCSPLLLGYNDKDSVAVGSLTFSVLVWMRVFGILGDRRADKHPNVFEGLQLAFPFLAILLATAAAQVLVSVFGGEAFALSRLGTREWAISIIAGATMIPVGIISRIIPDKFITSLIPRFLILLHREKDAESQHYMTGGRVNGMMIGRGRRRTRLRDEIRGWLASIIEGPRFTLLGRRPVW